MSLSSRLAGPLVSAALLAALVPAAYVLGHAGNSDSTVIHACVNPSGEVRIVSADGPACRAQESELHWNIQGPQGEPGEKGDQGDQGDQGDKGDQGDPGDKGDQGDPGDKGDQGDPGDKGDQGDPGLSGYEVREAESAVSSGTFRFTSVGCPAGKVVIGGGAQIGTADGQVFQTLPVALTVNNKSLLNSWQAAAIEMSPTDVEWKLIVRVICATVAD